MWADLQVQSKDKDRIITLDKLDQRSGMSAKAFIALCLGRDHIFITMYAMRG